MLKNLIWGALLVALVLGIATSQTAPTEPDPVLASFERELNHESAPVARVRRDDIDNDELYELVNAVHWTQEGPSSETEGDINE